MTEQHCHPDISPPSSSKVVMPHVFTCICPGTGCSTEPLDKPMEQKTLICLLYGGSGPTLEEPHLCFRQTSCQLGTFQTLHGLVTLVNSLYYICTTGWADFLPRSAEDGSCCPRAETQQYFLGDGLPLKYIPDWTTWQSWSSLAFLPFP